MSNLLDDILERFGALPDDIKAQVTKDAFAATASRYFIPNPGPQTEALRCDADELFFGGSAGGGKSALLCGTAVDDHDKSIIFRREYPQIKGLEDEVKGLVGSRDGYNAQDKIWRLPNGNVLEFGSVPHETDVEKYQGRAHSLKGFDEITHFCLHPATEVLTDRGWLPIADVETSDMALAMRPDGSSGYERISAVHAFDYNGPLHKTRHKRCRYAVTPNHKMVVVSQRSDKWRFIRADELPDYARYPFSKEWDGRGVERIEFGMPSGRGVGPNANAAAYIDARLWAEFLGWYLSEGSCFEVANGGPRISIRQTVRRASLDRMMAALPWRSKWVDGEGYYICSRQLFGILKPLGNRHEKRVPRWLLDSDAATLRAFWDAFVEGDGHKIKTGAVAIGLCNSGLRDDLQEVASKLGLRSTAAEQRVKSGHMVYRLSAYAPHVSTIWDSKGNRYTEHYEGKVHCLTVEPSHTFLCRIEGRTFWTGNSEAQYRFLIGWTRSTNPNQRCRVIATGNPPTTPEGYWVVKYWAPWLDKTHPNPAAAGELRYFTTIDGQDVECDGPEPVEVNGKMVRPRSRTFIPARLEDNPDLMATGYAAVLEAMPEELRIRFRDGRFDAETKDGDFQVIPTAWIKAAQARWTPKAPDGVGMSVLSHDVALGGGDANTFARRHGHWYDEVISDKLKGMVDPVDLAARDISLMRDSCPIVIDMGGGYGSGVYSHLKQHVAGITLHGHDGASSSGKRTRDGKLKFFNKRAEVWWKFREALEPNLGEPVALPPDPELLADLAAPTWKLGRTGIQIEEKAAIKSRLGRSPDKGDAVVNAWSYGEDSVSARIRTFNNPRGRPTVNLGRTASAAQRRRKG